MDELYDLKTDPFELKNLIDDPASAQTLTELKRVMQRLLKETG